MCIHQPIISILYIYIIVHIGKAHESTTQGLAKQYPGCTLYTRKKSGGKLKIFLLHPRVCGKWKMQQSQSHHLCGFRIGDCRRV